MSKTERDLPERLSSAGASPLEQRLLKAASGELPSVELSDRMARAIGVSLPAAGLATLAAGSKTAAAATKAASGSALAPWLSGVVAVAIAAGAFVGTRPGARTAPAASAASVATAARSNAPAAITASSLPAAIPLGAPPSVEAEVLPKTGARAPVPPALPRSRSAATATELAAQIALVDAARAALASGAAAGALSSVRDYQADYPNGAFRPEVAAIKIEALMKLGRNSEARALAERFASSYGRGPLADRVTGLVGAAQP